jgi:hypothetical protein
MLLPVIEPRTSEIQTRVNFKIVCLLKQMSPSDIETLQYFILAFTWAWAPYSQHIPLRPLSLIIQVVPITLNDG